jgi:hypothetical protein
MDSAPLTLLDGYLESDDGDELYYFVFKTQAILLKS